MNLLQLVKEISVTLVRNLDDSEGDEGEHMEGEDDVEPDEEAEEMLGVTNGAVSTCTKSSSSLFIMDTKSSVWQWSGEPQSQTQVAPRKGRKNICKSAREKRKLEKACKASAGSGRSKKGLQ